MVFCVSDVPRWKVISDPPAKYLTIGRLGFCGFLCFRCPLWKVTSDPPGKYLTLGRFGFRGFLCFRCPPLESHFRPTRQVSDIRGIRFSWFFVFPMSPGPPDKYLTLRGFGFRGFLCFRCPPLESHFRPTRQVSDIRAIRFSWFFVFPMSPSGKSLQTHPTSI